MERHSLPHRKIIYVCLNEREHGVCCGHGGAGRVHARLKETVKTKGLSRQVRVSRSGCMDRCKYGPNVLVFPDGIWFSGVTESDADTILDRVLEGIVASE